MYQLFPSKINSLERIARYSQISSVIDVGVQKDTIELRSVFPELKHFLFEPVTSFHDEIKLNYNLIDYELFPYALSDNPEELYLVVSSIHSNGCPTHSKLSSTPCVIDGMTILKCEKIAVERFDQIGVKVPSNYLLKIDVDGGDLKVLKGFGRELSNAAVIVLEATYNTLLDRLSYCIKYGFQLIDIVDYIYYGPSLYQFDLVFMREDLVTSSIRPLISNFISDLWKPIKINSQYHL